VTERGYTTNPLKVGAPLPESLVSLPGAPTLREIEMEMIRAEAELMYALARRRKAWSAMRRRAEEREILADKPGALTHLDSDHIWKKRVGDVGWWRDEVQTHSAALLALQGMRDRRHDTSSPSTPGLYNLASNQLA
jgi:hypothetical protein